MKKIIADPSKSAYKLPQHTLYYRRLSGALCKKSPDFFYPAVFFIMNNR